MPRHKLEQPKDDRGKKAAAVTTTAGIVLAATIAAMPPADDALDIALEAQPELVTEKIERDIPTSLPTLPAPTPAPTAVDFRLEREAPQPAPKVTPKPKPTVKATPKPTVKATPKATATTVKAVAPANWREAVIAEARRQIGVPYVWGGNSPSQGFDCSGLTRWAYRKAGLKTIPRVANDQMRAMKRTSNPQPGDLVFFLNSSGYAYHVGIVAGGGYMYSAPRAGLAVRKERIWSTRIAYRTPK